MGSLDTPISSPRPLLQQREAVHADEDFDLEGDTLREECGVFGILGHEDSATLTALGLHALQHRGQEAAGIVSFDGKQFHSERRMGLVGDHFTDSSVMEKLPGNSGIGHVRYSTTGETILRNVQPMFAELNAGGIAIAHNGNFTNSMTLRRQIIEQGAICQSTSDSEVVLHLIAKAKQKDSAARFVEAIAQVEGGYAIVALTRNKLIGARDTNGIRPLVYGEFEGNPIFASETCALDIIGAKFIRDVKPGEIIICERQMDGEIKVRSQMLPDAGPERLCLFEYVYFSRPDSIVGGRSVYSVRKRMGANLADEAGVEADVVVPVPDGGVPAALGYSQASGIPFEYGIIRNHYVGRTFIEPNQRIRALGVRLKHSANRDQLKGKRVILVDDSIVRGTTSHKIVQLVRDAGASEVHLRVASPQITHPDFYGIDTPDREKLLANRFESMQEMCDFIGADTLEFLSIEGIYQAVGEKKRNPNNPQFTDHCFTGDYPTILTDLDKSGMPTRINALLKEAI